MDDIIGNDLFEDDLELLLIEDDDEFGAILGKFRAKTKESRINRMVGKIAKIYAKGDVDKAKRLSLKLGGVVDKLISLDPDWSPSPQIQSWLDFGTGVETGPNAGSSGYEEEGVSYSDQYDDPGYAPSGSDDDLLQELQGVLSAPVQVQGGYQQGPASIDGYLPAGSRSPWEDPNAFMQPGRNQQQQHRQNQQRQQRQQQQRRQQHRQQQRRQQHQQKQRRLPGAAAGGSNRAFPRFRGDSFGVAPGIRSVQKRLQSKNAAYDRAKNLGHIKRAERLATDMDQLQAKIAAARGMGSFETDVYEIEAGPSDAALIAEAAVASGGGYDVQRSLSQVEKAIQAAEEAAEKAARRSARGQRW